jgi:DNA-binding NtrC family response regulator
MSLAINVLVVDDEQDSRELLVGILSANGYCARSAANGEEALEMLKFMDCDMVISDLHMPGMGGIELMSRIKSTYPGVAFILMTGDAWPQLASEVKRRGAFDVIFKPFKYAQLQSVMKKGLQHYRKDRRCDSLIAE